VIQGVKNNLTDMTLVSTAFILINPTGTFNFGKLTLQQNSIFVIYQDNNVGISLGDIQITNSELDLVNTQFDGITSSQSTISIIGNPTNHYDSNYFTDVNSNIYFYGTNTPATVDVFDSTIGIQSSSGPSNQNTSTLNANATTMNIYDSILSYRNISFISSNVYLYNSTVSISTLVFQKSSNFTVVSSSGIITAIFLDASISSYNSSQINLTNIQSNNGTIVMLDNSDLNIGNLSMVASKIVYSGNNGTLYVSSCSQIDNKTTVEFGETDENKNYNFNSAAGSQCPIKSFSIVSNDVKCSNPHTNSFVFTFINLIDFATCSSGYKILLSSILLLVLSIAI